MTLSVAKIKAAMTDENRLVKGAIIDKKETFYLGEYTFGTEQEYVLVVKLNKGTMLFLNKIEMTLDGKVADGTVKKEKVSRVIIDSVSETFTRRKLIEYAESRAVPKDVLERYCDEVIYHIDGMPDRKFFAIGFRNNGGGYVLRSSVAKKCSTGDMTTLGPDGKMTDKVTGDKVIVFEGFMDFLSWISHVKQVTPEHDCCILNSVANIGRALPWITSHSSIAAFMDNDKAGRDTLQKIIDNVPETAGDVCVYDMAKLYEGYNDLNEKLSDEMNGSEHSSINIHNHGDNTI
jgi:hypothetical protein